MSNALKQYLEKELQSKKFLQEGLDFVKEVDKLASTKKDLTTDLERLDKSHSKASKEFLDLKAEVDATRQTLKNLKADAQQVIDDATELAKTIEADARKKAKQTADEADARLNTVEDQISERKTELAKVTKEVQAQEKRLVTIQEEQTALLEKLKRQRASYDPATQCCCP